MELKESSFRKKEQERLQREEQQLEELGLLGDVNEIQGVLTQGIDLSQLPLLDLPLPPPPLDGPPNIDAIPDFDLLDQMANPEFFGNIPGKIKSLKEK